LGIKKEGRARMSEAKSWQLELEAYIKQGEPEGKEQMKREMTIPALKKRLAELERKELEKMLCDVYKNCDQAEQMLNLTLLDETYGKNC
jgi:hypothetical protein